MYTEPILLVLLSPWALFSMELASIWLLMLSALAARMTTDAELIWLLLPEAVAEIVPEVWTLLTIRPAREWDTCTEPALTLLLLPVVPAL
jgi:hypothetical protein